MPLTLTEKLDSRKWTTGDNASVEMVYILTGTSDDVTAKNLIASSTAGTYNGLVRQSIQIEPEWVDITVPVYSFSETHYLDAAVVTPAYKGTLFSLTGKVNSASFKGLAAGECLFLGASGSMRGAEDWEITYRFAGSPNRTGLVVGPISGISKKGWEYMWVRYADSEDAAAKAIVKKPVAVYIERVYEEGNFAALGIGT